MAVVGNIDVVKTSACSIMSELHKKAVRADVVWTLNAFSTVDKRQKLRSPNFDVTCGDVVTRWALGVERTSGEDIGLFLYADAKATSIAGYWAKSEFKLGEGEFEVVDGDEATDPPDLFKAPYHGWGNHEVIKRDALLTNCVKNNQLVVCLLKASVMVFHSHLEDSKPLIDLATSLCEQNLGDFTICCGKEDVKVVKNSLIQASPVFVAMLATDMQESKEGILKVEDLDAGTVKSMVKCIYVPGLLTEDMDPAKLIIAAEKYQLADLKQLCSDRLLRELSFDNVAEILKVAKYSNSLELKKAAEDMLGWQPLLAAFSALQLD